MKKPDLKTVLAPRMIQSMEILQLPIADLQAKIDEALQENPFLELEEKHGEHDETGDLEFNRLEELNRDWDDHFNEEHRAGNDERPMTTNQGGSLMLAFIVVLRSGHRYTVRAEELRSNENGIFELLAVPATAPDSTRGKQVVAVFDRNDVVSVVAREHLVASEEPGEGGARPHVIAKSDPIPF
jgi:hypothetical protein